MNLDDLPSAKRRELERARAASPLADQRARAGAVPPPRPFRIPPEPGPILIVEIDGPEGPHRAALCETAGASALSVATDALLLGGRIQDLPLVRAAAALPVFRRDFVIDEYQIWESRALEADGLPFFARLLDRNQLSEYVHLARELGMAALVEVRDERDLVKALPALDRPSPDGSPGIIAFDNRDPATDKVNLETAVRLAPHVPPTIALAARCLPAGADLALLRASAIRAAILGRELFADPDPGGRLRTLAGRGAR